MIRNIIFDWSGTLVDDLPAVWRATNEVFRRSGVAEITLDRFRADFSLPYHGFYARYVGHVAPRQLEEWFLAHFGEVQHLVTELPHARGFLEFCRAQGLRTFVLSTVFRAHFEEQAGRLGFDRYIDHAYLGVADKRGRIHELLATHRLEARETVFVGDMQHDIETAHHGGVWSCAVLTGYNRLEQLRDSRPDWIVEHLGEFRELLRTGRAGAALDGGGADAARAPVATVGALVTDGEGRVLMIQTRKWSDLWGIPGGKIQYGEASVAALRREIREETGLEIDDIRFVLVQDCIRSPEFYREAHFLLLNYVCRAAGGTEVRLNEEAQAYRWATPEEALALPLNRPTRVLLEAWQAGAEGAARPI